MVNPRGGAGPELLTECSQDKIPGSCLRARHLKVPTRSSRGTQLPAQPAPVGTWTTKVPRPAITNEAAAVAIGGKLYAPGGSDKGKSVTRLDEYAPTTDRWRALADLPQPLDHLAVEAVNGKLYAFGGFAAVIHAGAADAALE
jgi:hypothetical protein